MNGEIAGATGIRKREVSGLAIATAMKGNDGDPFIQRVSYESGIP